jgi:hypothetical protein
MKRNALDRTAGSVGIAIARHAGPGDPFAHRAWVAIGPE